MKSIHSDIIEEKKSNIDIDPPKIEKKSIYLREFEINYEILSPIMKDLQMMSQLIKLIKNYQFSDLIFITGNRTCEVNSRFYFNYRKMADLYLLVLDSEENENSLKITYHVYKTKPICLNFFIGISLVKNENNSKLEMEIIPPKGMIFPEKILNIIYDEIDYNFLYLSLALKLKKDKLIYFNSGIIQNEFFVLSQIIQNIKLIEYIINGKFININDKNNEKEESQIDDKDKYIHLNDVYKVKLSRHKEQTSLNDISFKIINFKSREDKLTINLKMIFDKKEKEKNDSNLNPIYNVISINLVKITKNSSFILIKGIFDSNVSESSESNKDIITKLLKKALYKIEKLSNISKNKISF